MSRDKCAIRGNLRHSLKYVVNVLSTVLFGYAEHNKHVSVSCKLREGVGALAPTHLSPHIHAGLSYTGK